MKNVILAEYRCLLVVEVLLYGVESLEKWIETQTKDSSSHFCWAYSILLYEKELKEMKKFYDVLVKEIVYDDYFCDSHIFTLIKDFSSSLQEKVRKIVLNCKIGEYTCTNKTWSGGFDIAEGSIILIKKQFLADIDEDGLIADTYHNG